MNNNQISTKTIRLFIHMGKSWKHHFSLQMATMIVLVASFSVISGLLTVSNNLYRILTLWGDSMQMSVYLRETATDENISSVRKFIEDSRDLEKPQLVSKEDALLAFRDQMASYAPDLLNDKDLLRFIPSSIQFGLNKNIAPSEQLGVMQASAKMLKAMPGVEDVNFGQDWVKTYSALTQALTWGGGFFVLIILISATFVMANSIHTSITQRRGEIEVMELIGATANYIRMPFIWEGAVLGGFSSALALSLSFGFFLAIKDYMHRQIAFLQLSTQIQFMGLVWVAFVIAFGLLAGAFSAWLCVRKINDGWAASQNSRG